MHREKLPVLVRIPYAPKEPKGPKINAMGAPIAFDDISLTIDSAKLEYVKIDDSGQGKGFSSEPLLKIAYTIENKSGEEVIYDPAHRALSGPGAMLFGKSPYKRVRFPATTTVPGQVAGQVKLEPGKSTSDVVLFEVQDDGSEATLEFPASQFSRSGLARVRIEFDPAKPESPKELKKKSEPKKSEDG